MWAVIGSDGKEYGPVDERVLRDWVSQGRITPDTMLLDMNRQPVRAGNVAALFAPSEIGPLAAYPRGNPSLAPKSKLVAMLLAFFLGSFGIHRYYLGHNDTGTAMLLLTVLTCGIGGIITGVWAIVDMILIATGSLGDRNGAPVV